MRRYILGLFLLAMASAPAAVPAEGAPEILYRLEHDGLTVIDPATLTVLDRIPLLEGGRQLATSPDGRWAYVLGFWNLQIVDLPLRRLHSAVPINHDYSYQMRVAADGRLLLLRSDGNLTVHAADGRVETRVDLPAPPSDGGRVFISAFEPDDTSAALAWLLRSADEDGGGRSLWIDRVDLDAGALAARVRVQADDRRYFDTAAVASQSGLAFVSSGLYRDGGGSSSHEMLEVDLASGAVRGRAPLPAGALPVWDDVQQRLHALTYRRWPDDRSETELFSVDLSAGRARQLATYTGWPIGDVLARAGALWINLDVPGARTVLVDGHDGRELGSLPADADVHALAIAPAHAGSPPLPHPTPAPAAPQSYRALVLSGAAQTVTEIDTGGAAVTGVRIDPALRGFVAFGTTADAGLTLGGFDDTIARMDTASGRIERLRFRDDFCCLVRGAVSPDGSRILAADWSVIWDIDPSTGRERGEFELPDGDEIEALAFTADGSQALVAASINNYDFDWGVLHVVDAVSRRPLWSVQYPGQARALVASTDGTRAFIGTDAAVVVVDLSAAAIAGLGPVAAQALAVAADGTRVYAGGGRTWRGEPLALTAIDTATLRAVATVDIAGAGTATDLELTPDGQRALLAVDGTPARLAIVDLPRFALVAALPVSAQPAAVVIDPRPWPPPLPPTPLPRREPGALRPCMVVPLCCGTGPLHGTIALVDPSRHSVATTIQVGEEITDWQGNVVRDGVSAAVADPDGTRLYVLVSSATGGAGHLATIDAASGAVLARLPVGIAPWLLLLSRDGDRAFVANGNGYYEQPSLSIVDLQRWQVIDEVGLPNGTVGLFPSADGRLLFARTRERQREDWSREVVVEQVVAVDPTNGAVAFSIPLHTGIGSIDGIAVLPDGRTLLADTTDVRDDAPERVAVIDLERRETVAHIEVPASSPSYRGSATFAASADGTEVYRGTQDRSGAVTVIDPIARTVTGQIPVTGGFVAPAFTPDGAAVYGLSGGGIAVIDVADRVLAASIAFDASPSRPVAAWIDGACEGPVRPSPTSTPTAGPEPTPTPIATWSGTWVDLRTESVTGRPGTTVEVAVLFDSALPVAGTQISIAWELPLSIAADAEGRPACRAHPESGKPSAFAFWPPDCSGSDCRMVRALTFSLDSIDLIPRGARLFTCDVAIAADAAPGDYRLRVSDPGASDPHGVDLPARGVNGVVTILPSGSLDHSATAGSANGCAIAPAPAGGAVWLLLPLLLAPWRRFVRPVRGSPVRR